MRRELIIFGATGNLGRGVIEFFLDKEYDKIYLVGRNFGSAPGREKTVLIRASDLSEDNNMQEVFNSIKPEPDTLYFLFDTIGGFLGGKPVWETSYEEFDKMMKMNLYTAFLTARYFALLVQKSAGGAICFTSAMTSTIPEAKKIAYGVSKSGLNYLVKSLAIEGRQINLSVNAVAPFNIDTEENREWVKNPADLIKPEDIGRIAHELFNNFKVISGSIIKLPGSLP